MEQKENEATVTLKSAGNGVMHVYVGSRYVGNVEKIRGEDAWKAVPLSEVSHAHPVGIGKARTAEEAARFFVRARGDRTAEGVRRDRLGRIRRPEQDATTFKPLDPDSPTVLLQVRVTQALLDQVDAAAATAGVTRSELVRRALKAAVYDEPA